MVGLIYYYARDIIAQAYQLAGFGMPYAVQRLYRRYYNSPLIQKILYFQIRQGILFAPEFVEAHHSALFSNRLEDVPESASGLLAKLVGLGYPENKTGAVLLAVL